jgi:hypothetical protein
MWSIDIFVRSSRLSKNVRNLNRRNVYGVYSSHRP